MAEEAYTMTEGKQLLKIAGITVAVYIVMKYLKMVRPVKNMLKILLSVELLQMIPFVKDIEIDIEI